MQHSLLRNKGEVVKLFSHKDPTKVQKTLLVYSFTPEEGIQEILYPNPNITDLNVGYYSTEITTPDFDCYLLILFCGNPIVLRIGNPPLQFMYWSGKRINILPYHHFDEFGVLKAQGDLLSLGYGFYYYTPVEETLGYIEVEGRPHILNVPYSVQGCGVGIDIDWQRSIKRQTFGVNVKNQVFKLNNVKSIEFSRGVIEHKFDLDVSKNKFDVKTIKRKFTVFCKR